MVGLRAANVMLSLVVILIVAALFYKDYASLIRNNKSVVKMLTPSNFVAGTIKFTEQRYFTRNLPLVKIGEDARKGPLIAGQAKKTLVIWWWAKPPAPKTSPSAATSAKPTRA